MTIRLAKEEDAEALLAIYGPYVRDTAISFEYQVPSLKEFRRRITATLVNYPFFVAEDSRGRLLGYAYAHEYNPRPGYGWVAEVTIYLAPEAKGQGLGKSLYESLETELAKQEILQLVACITGDNLTSQEFHERLGYQLVGSFANFAQKFDTWYDIVWMQKTIKEPTERATAMIPYSSLKKHV